MSSQIQSSRDKTSQRVLELLGSGVAPVNVAAACGISEARVSQLMSDENFSREVTDLRFQNLHKHTERDNAYDKMEDRLLKQLEDNLCLVQRPMEIAKLLQVMNTAKRRGQSAPEQLTNQQTVVTLLMPVQITQKFTTNVNNQVIVAGQQTLETVQSNALLNATKQKALGLHNAQAGTVIESELSSSGT